MAFLAQASSTRNRAIISDEVNDFPRLPAAADPWFCQVKQFTLDGILALLLQYAKFHRLTRMERRFRQSLIRAAALRSDKLLIISIADCSEGATVFFKISNTGQSWLLPITIIPA